MPDPIGQDGKDRELRLEGWEDGGLPPLHMGGKARFPGLFVASLPPQQEGSHAGTEGVAGLRGGGSPLLLRCGLVCGNGNVRGPRGHVRGPRAGGGDAKRHDELCPPTLGPRSGTKRRSWLVKPPMPLRFRTFEPALQQQPAAKKSPGRRETLGASKNRGYLLSQLVGQYHRRW